MGKRSKIGGYARGVMTAAALLAAGAAVAAESCAEDQVTLRGDWGQARFTIELADDPDERAQGLMHRESMAQSAGMLFVYPEPKQVGFWMKNTLIPLDMIFLDATGTVKKVHSNAIPHDETPIFGGSPDIKAVLEINGGLSERLGIVAGSELRHPAFEPSEAAWPC